MTSVHYPRLACYFCNEYLVGRRDDDLVKNCFGYSYGPRENPFLHPRHQKKWSKAPTDVIGLQTVLLRCGHIFHKGCLKKSMQRENGSLSRTGNCPICQKAFILGKITDIHLKVSEIEKISEKRQRQFEANEKQRLEIRLEIESLRRLILAYEKGFAKTRQTIVSDATIMVQRIREMRRRRRLLDRFQHLHLDPLEVELDQVYDENRLWKQLLGKPMPVDTEGNYVATPHSPYPSYVSCTATEDELPYLAVPPDAIPSSPAPLEFIRRLSSPLGPDGDPRIPRHDADYDYTRYWNLVPSAVSSTSKTELMNKSSSLVNFPRPPTSDSDADYDIGVFAAKIRAKLKREEEAKEMRKAQEEELIESGFVIPQYNQLTERGFPYTPLSQEHWEDSGTELGSDYKLDATSIVGSTELRKRCDVGRILDPDRAFSKWRKMVGVALKFDYKYENGLIDWDNEFAHYPKISRRDEDFMLKFVGQKWKR